LYKIKIRNSSLWKNWKRIINVQPREIHLGSDNPVHGCLSEGVKLLVLAAHELRLQQVAAPAVVLELALISQYMLHVLIKTYYFLFFGM
jgi:hypothetical protein